MRADLRMHGLCIAPRDAQQRAPMSNSRVLASLQTKYSWKDSFKIAHFSGEAVALIVSWHRMTASSDSVLIDAQARLGQHRLQHHAQFVNLADIGHGESSCHDALVRIDRHQPLGPQIAQFHLRETVYRK